MMRCNWKLVSTLTLLALVTLPPATARADEIFNYTASLESANEVPPVDSMSLGGATLLWNATTAQLVVEVALLGPSLEDLQDPPLHIHGLATSEETAGVILQLGEAGDWFELDQGTGIGIDFNEVLTGSEIDLSCTDDAACLVAFQEALDHGMTYMNFHTAQYPSGELRGQIVPEPTASALAAAALAGSHIVNISPSVPIRFNKSVCSVFVSPRSRDMAIAVC